MGIAVAVCGSYATAQVHFLGHGVRSPRLRSREGLIGALTHFLAVLYFRFPHQYHLTIRELLIPWVHYIPFNEDATDVEEKMLWVLNHDKQAQHIAERASLWIEDLCFHPDAVLEDRLIQEEMIRRYVALFTSYPQ